jgi:hypothetical protein
MDQDTTRPRVAFMLRGGRIFMILAIGGGLLTCWGAVSTRVSVFTSMASFGDGVVVRPISGPNPTMALAALASGLVMVILALSFIVLRRTNRRAVLAVALILTGIGTAWAFTDLRIGDPASLVPAELLSGLPICRTEVLGPCVHVYWPTETIVWGGWIAAFWGALALIRVRPSMAASTHAGVKRGVPAPTNVSHLQLVAEEPTTTPQGLVPQSDPPRRRVLTDAKVLAWIVGIPTIAAAFLLVGLVLLLMTGIIQIQGP